MEIEIMDKKEDSLNLFSGLCEDCERGDEFKSLKEKNEELRTEIFNLLNDYMMSDERDLTMEKINALIDNEIEQEKLCNN
ncbi:MAG: hypothetical protein ACFFG0_02915 [Candidatus Thorarchaeota archaeon]